MCAGSAVRGKGGRRQCSRGPSLSAGEPGVVRGPDHHAHGGGQDPLS